MGQREFDSVQHLAGDFAGGGFAQAGVLPPPIDRVPGDGEAQVLKVDADLMGATGVQVHLNMGGVMEQGENAIGGAGLPPGPNRHAFAIGVMAGDWGVDFAAGNRKAPANDCLIGFLNLAGGKLRGQSEMGGVVFGHHQAAAGFLVKAMDDAGAGHAADAAELAGAMVQQGVDQSMTGMSGGGVDDEAGRLVEREQIVVFVENLQRHFFGLGRHRHRFRN